jgi:hypothetical protein
MKNVLMQEKKNRYKIYFKKYFSFSFLPDQHSCLCFPTNKQIFEKYLKNIYGTRFSYLALKHFSFTVLIFFPCLMNNLFLFLLDQKWMMVFYSTAYIFGLHVKI